MLFLIIRLTIYRYNINDIKMQIKKEGNTMIDTKIANTDTKLHLYNIDFNHLVENSLPSMMSFFKPYLKQGAGSFTLPELGINKEQIITPRLIKGYQGLIALKRVKPITYNGRDTLKVFTLKVLNNYLNWLKLLYKKQRKFDYQQITNCIHKSKNYETLLFSPQSYSNYVATHIKIGDARGIAEDYLMLDPQHNFINDLVAIATQVKTINNDTLANIINYLFDVSNKNKVDNAKMAFLTNWLQQLVLGENNIKIIMINQKVNYEEMTKSLVELIVRFLKQKLCTLPLHMLAEIYFGRQELQQMKFTFKLINQDDLNIFVDDLVNFSSNPPDLSVAFAYVSSILKIGDFQNCQIILGNQRNLITAKIKALKSLHLEDYPDIGQLLQYMLDHF